MKNNSGVNKIIFEEFPGNKGNKKEKKRKFSQIKINKFVFFIIVILFFFILSSILNLKFLDASLNDKYKLVNKTNEDFATIKEKEKIFYNIGFKTVRQSVKALDSNFYECTEASSSTIMEDYKDQILVYYDIDNKVQKIDFELIFKESDFAYKNSNAVLKNFVNVDINKNMIDNAMNNNNVNYSDDEKDIYLEYSVLSYNYKKLKVVIER